MSLFIRSCYSITLCLSLGMASTSALAINAKSGLWEWSTTFKLPGSNFGLPAVEYRSCISSKNLAPKPPGSDNCKITSHKIEEDHVDWALECTVKNQTYIHTGHLTFNGTTAMGESQASSNGSAMTSMILGSYVGPCR